MAYRLSQLIGHYLFTVLASARPCTLFYCITVKQAFGNLGLLAGYGTKPIGPGLGRDKKQRQRHREKERDRQTDRQKRVMSERENEKSDRDRDRDRETER